METARLRLPLYLSDKTVSLQWAVIVLVCLLHVPIAWKASRKNDVSQHVWQAHAWLNGKMDIPVHQYDVAVYQGKNYVAYPPLPAVLLLLPVALIGANDLATVPVSVVATCFAVLFFLRILQALQIGLRDSLWLTAAFFGGTAYFFVMLTGHYVYGLSHVVCTAFLLGGLNEFFGKRRMWLMAAFFGAAFLCRQMTIFYGLFVLIAAYEYAEGHRLRAAISYGSVSLIFITAYLTVNYLRFDNPFDTGYGHIPYEGMLGERVRQYGLFSLQYVPFNLYHLLLKGHDVVFTGADGLKAQGMDLFGTSLTAASPFLLAGFYQRLPRLQMAGVLTVTLLITALLLCYHNNGWHQVNAQRFTLDFLPLLMLPVISAWHHFPRKIFKALIAYSTIVNLFTLLFHYATRS